MNLTLSAEDEAFLAEVRDFLRPFRGSLNYVVTTDHAAAEHFYRALAAKGWLGLGWPIEHGGLGGSKLREFLLWNEIAYEGIARPPQGVGIIAKTLMRYGTADQKLRWLESIRRHDVTFALAYSEPNAGSDLASLSCRAVATGDGFVVTGNKCWNSKAHVVSHLWLLVRTGEQRARGRALSLFIVDADGPGVTIRPIEQMDGNVFTEIFFDDVHLSADRLIGEQDGAWSMIGEALAEERHIHFGPGRVRSDFKLVVEWAARSGRDRDPVVRAALLDLAVQVFEAEAQALPMLNPDATAAQAASNKLTHTRVLQAIARTAMDFGADALLAENGVERLWRQTMTETIGGGTTQIMEGIVARQRLNLGPRT